MSGSSTGPEDPKRRSDDGLPALLGVVGPTASGKEGLALRVAPRLGAEILSLDSMKVYRGMDIGTAKAPARARRDVPHHLVDVVEPHESFNVKRYVESADACIAEIRDRGRHPMLVGGTVLYLKTLLFGLSGPGSDPELRRRLHDECGRRGAPALHADLVKVDAAAAERIHPNDERRIVRALEVHELTGRPISSFQTDFDREDLRYDVRLVGIRRERADQHDRIDRRIDRMVDEGLVEEVARIRSAGGYSREASQALGYKEILGHLGGEMTLEEALERLRNATHRFARHQMTWLRRFPMIHWIDAGPEDDASSLEERAVAILSATSGESPRRDAGENAESRRLTE